MKRTVAALFLTLSAATALAGSIGAATYGQSLVRQALHDDPAVLALAMHVTPPKAADNVVVASSDAARLGSRSAAAILAVLASGRTTSALDSSGKRLQVLVPLRDVSGDAIGVLSVEFAWHAGAERAALEHEGERVADRLHRRISHAGNLLDPDPYDGDLPHGTYAQKLADEVIERNPDVQIFAIHATPPESDYNVIAGSNIGRIGKKGDNDDLRCVFTGKPNLEVNASGKRFEVEMQLHDSAGRVIGAVSVVYGYKAGDDKASLHERAERIRAELEKRIPDSESLFRPAA